MRQKLDEEVETFLLMCKSMREEMIKLVKKDKINKEQILKISDYFRLKKEDGIKLDIKDMNNHEIEQLVIKQNPRIHLGYAIESIRMMNCKIKDGCHYYNLLRKVGEDPKNQVEVKKIISEKEVERISIVMSKQQDYLKKIEEELKNKV